MPDQPAPDHRVRPTLAHLLGRRELRLRLITAPEGAPLHTPIRWVHSSDLDDPTPFLSEGLVLLTTGTQFAADEGESDAARIAAREYVARLLRRGVLALGFGTEVVREGTPAPLVAACHDAGLALFEVPYSTPFIAVARANAEALAAVEYARRTWALGAQRAISLAALRADGVGATVGELSRQLGAWVGLFDARGRLTVSHPPGQPAGDALSREVAALLARRAPASTTVGAETSAAYTPATYTRASYTVQTLGGAGTLTGALAVASTDLDAQARAVVTSAVALVGLAGARTPAPTAHRDEGAARERVLALARTHPGAGAPMLATSLWGGFPEPPFTLALVELPEAAMPDALDWLGERAPERVFFAPLSPPLAATPLAAQPPSGALRQSTGQARLAIVITDAAATPTIEPSGNSEPATLPAPAELTELSSRFGATAGLAAAADTAELDAAWQGASIALAHAGAGDIRHIDDVAAGGLLTAAAASLRPLAEAKLAPLTAHDAQHGTALVRTVRAFLENDASHEATARALDIHRHTVRTRMALAERVLNQPLASFAARAELWAALVTIENAALDTHPAFDT